MGVCSHTGSRKALLAEADTGLGREAAAAWPKFTRRHGLVLDFRVLRGLAHAFVEPSGLIWGNYKRAKVPKDWEGINMILPIFAKQGERWILIILSCSFNIWETLPKVLSQPAMPGLSAEP